MLFRFKKKETKVSKMRKITSKTSRNQPAAVSLIDEGAEVVGGGAGGRLEGMKFLKTAFLKIWKENCILLFLNNLKLFSPLVISNF